MIDGVGGRIEAQFGHRLFQRLDRLLHFADDPLVRSQLRFRRLDRRGSANAVRLAEARRIPKLGCEVAIPFDPLLIHLDVAALAFHRRHEETQCVRAILVDQAQRIDNVAL